jgi:hypothetical protein
MVIVSLDAEMLTVGENNVVEAATMMGGTGINTNFGEVKTQNNMNETASASNVYV